MSEPIKDYPPYLDYPKPYKPQTNGDRIRAMDDENLAWELMDFRIDAFTQSGGHQNALPNTQKKIREWLQQPAEVDDDR